MITEHLQNALACLEAAAKELQEGENYRKLLQAIAKLKQAKALTEEAEVLLLEIDQKMTK